MKRRKFIQLSLIATNSFLFGLGFRKVNAKSTNTGLGYGGYGYGGYGYGANCPTVHTSANATPHHCSESSTKKTLLPVKFKKR